MHIVFPATSMQEMRIIMDFFSLTVSQTMLGTFFDGLNDEAICHSGVKYFLEKNSYFSMDTIFTQE